MNKLANTAHTLDKCPDKRLVSRKQPFFNLSGMVLPLFVLSMASSVLVAGDLDKNEIDKNETDKDAIKPSVIKESNDIGIDNQEAKELSPNSDAAKTANPRDPESGPDRKDEPVTASANGLAISHILIEGNDKTKPITILREILVKIGDVPTQKELLVASQAVMDLKLFEWVSINMVDNNLVISLEEKWYILPIPRLSADVSGDSSYGISVKWYNFRGLNDTLDFAVYQSTFADSDRGDSLTYRVRYDAPYIFNTDTDISIGLQHREESNDDELEGNYDQTEDSFELRGSRWLRQDAANKGWRHSLGIHWRNITHDRALSTIADGQATSISLGIEYRDITFKLFSETGVVLRYDFETDLGFLGNDYNFTRQRVKFDWFMDGAVKHHTFHFGAQVGVASGGRRGTEAYEIGGKSTVRGYKSDDIDNSAGDAFYTLRFEYFAPVFKSRSVRGFVFMDVGDVYDDIERLDASGITAAAGFGVRWRVTEIVDLEIELGIGFPFSGDGGPQAFGGKV